MKIKTFFSFLGCVVLLLAGLVSCNDELEGKTFFTSDEMTIVETLEANPELYSSYVEILEKTDLYSSLKTYGSYTSFAPTNEAVQKYISERFSVNSVSELNSPEHVDFLKLLVKFHTLPTTRRTEAFIEGRLADTTYTGDFITTSFVQGGGIANVKINKVAGLGVYDIETNNGVIHTLTEVLDPYIDPLPVVMDKAGKHNIFVEAMKQTGYYERLSAIFNEFGSKNNFTILAESDEVYAQEGINSFQDLVDLISPDDSDFQNEENDLNRYVAYHATLNFMYSINFPADNFVGTVLPNNTWKSLKTDDVLKINETETGINDTWTSLVIDQSNNPSKNGVYHTVNKLFRIFTPKAKYLIFDPIVDQPEYQSGLVQSGTRYPSSAYAGVSWFPEADMRFLADTRRTAYNNVTFSMSGLQWYEFRTPVLPKGKYEVTVCGNGGTSTRGQYQTFWDGEPIGAIWNATLRTTAVGFPDEILMEANGWRPGLPWITNRDGDTAYDSTAFGRFIITKELLCPVTESHVIRFRVVQQGGIGLDYIEFTPVE